MAIFKSVRYVCDSCGLESANDYRWAHILITESYFDGGDEVIVLCAKCWAVLDKIMTETKLQHIKNREEGLAS